MRVTFAPKGVLQIDDAVIIYKNLSGEPSKFNREGDKNFAVVIPDEGIAESLMNEGWNIKIKPARDEGDGPFMYLPVKVKFNDRGPNVYLQSGKNRNKLDIETIGCLDRIRLSRVDMDIRPYDWEVNGKAGRTAYLQSMFAYQQIDDRFAERYAHPEE